MSSAKSDAHAEAQAVLLCSVVQSSPDAIIAVSRNGKITFFSQGAEKMLGCSSEEMLGAEFLSLFTGDAFGEAGRWMRQALGGEEILNKRASWVAKDGRKINLSLSFSRLGNEENQGIVVVARDITREAEAESEIGEYLAQIKEYVSQLEHTSELKDLFADVMRHEILNPLTVIKNMTLELQEEKLSPAQRSRLALIQRSTNRIENIVDGAIKYTKLLATEELEFSACDLAAIMRSAAEAMRSAADAKEIKIEARFKGAYPARANPCLEEVFANLISNAIKYSPSKTRVVLEIEERENCLCAAVKDNGIGIPEEDKRRIFERFERLERGNVRGVGLGLAIVKRIVELHSGKVWVEDNPEGGSIFYVKLPKAA